MIDGLFNLQFLMFAVMLAGFLLCRTGAVKTKERELISALVLNLLLPCSIFSSFKMEMSREVLMNFLQIFIISVLIEAFSILVCRFCYRRIPDGKRSIFQYATVVSNAGFLGNAVAEGVFGPEGLVCAQIYLIPLRIVMWTAGITYLSPDHDKAGGMKKLLRHPCIIACELGVVRMLLQVRIPEMIDNTISTLGKCSTPMVMIFLGMVMAEVGFRTMLTRYNFLLMMIRLVLIPSLVLGACMLFRVSPLAAGVSVLLAAMPVGTTTAILAQEYHADVEFAADAVVLSTLVSIAILPLWTMIIHAVFPL
ncbi:MAG: AEC family transporter [Lachnospiraceae bacterium]|nr:AEC family transporter [Lachnospiraceae bacterium]